MRFNGVIKYYIWDDEVKSVKRVNEDCIRDDDEVESVNWVNEDCIRDDDEVGRVNALG